MSIMVVITSQNEAFNNDTDFEYSAENVVITSQNEAFNNAMPITLISSLVVITSQNEAFNNTEDRVIHYVTL